MCGEYHRNKACSKSVYTGIAKRLSFLQFRMGSALYRLHCANHHKMADVDFFHKRTRNMCRAQVSAFVALFWL